MVKKIHTQIKRKLKLSTRFKHESYFKSMPKKRRPKTFSTEENAKKYAQEKGIKNYTLKKVKLGKRFQIVEQKE